MDSNIAFTGNGLCGLVRVTAKLKSDRVDAWKHYTIPVELFNRDNEIEID